jgi:hypothetical protein
MLQVSSSAMFGAFGFAHNHTMQRRKWAHLHAYLPPFYSQWSLFPRWRNTGTMRISEPKKWRELISWRTSTGMHTTSFTTFNRTIRLVWTRGDSSTEIGDMNIVGMRLHSCTPTQQVSESKWDTSVLGMHLRLHFGFVICRECSGRSVFNKLTLQSTPVSVDTVRRTMSGRDTTSSRLKV